MRRSIICTLPALLLCACASEGFKPLEFKPNVVLQDAPPGKAIVYLMRAPYDRVTLPVYFNEGLMASLPAATYTMVIAEPGSYAVASSPNGRSESKPASLLSLRPDERRFLYVSAPTGRSLGVTVLPMGKAGFIPLMLPAMAAVGAHTWQECTELDAQGLMSNARLVFPEDSSL